MLSAKNLKDNPFVSKEMDYSHTFIPPPTKEISCSDWLLTAIENDEIDKIYAMRILPFHDLMALKIKYKYDDGPISEIISRPEFCVLKYIWDCGNKKFNAGIRHYLFHSKHALYQYKNKEHFPYNTKKHNQWYFEVLLEEYKYDE